MIKLSYGRRKKIIKILSNKVNSVLIMNNSRDQEAVHLLGEASTEREHKFLQYSANVQGSSDEEGDAESPIFDLLCNVGGDESILKMTNFIAPEFCKLYSTVQHCIST